MLWVLAAVAHVSDAHLVRETLCESQACGSIWLSPFPISASTTAQGAWDSAIDECFQLVNGTACADCAKGAIEDGEDGTCTHLLFYTQPQPISSQFPFCSGHSSTQPSHAMSVVRWMSFIRWRNDACPGALKQSAWTCKRQTRLEATWLPFYKKGTTGWTSQLDAPCESNCCCESK